MGPPPPRLTERSRLRTLVTSPKDVAGSATGMAEVRVANAAAAIKMERNENISFNETGERDSKLSSEEKKGESAPG